jgi:hypothetical protein
MKVVGLVGRKRSGKDTAAEIFESKGWYRTSFAKALYTEVSEAFGVSVEQLQEHEHKEVPWVPLEGCKDAEFVELAKALARVSILDREDRQGIFTEDLVDIRLSPRRILQWWGTEYRRKDDTFYWVRRLSEELAAAKPERVIISDIREIHEAAYVKRQDQGILVKVIRPDPHLDKGTGTHTSETGVDSINTDYEILNFSKLESFKLTVELFESKIH